MLRRCQTETVKDYKATHISSADTDVLTVRVVGWLEFNVPFQHKCSSSYRTKQNTAVRNVSRQLTTSCSVGGGGSGNVMADLGDCSQPGSAVRQTMHHNRRQVYYMDKPEEKHIIITTKRGNRRQQTVSRAPTGKSW